MAWRPGKSPVSSNVLKPPTPTRSPAAESVATPALGSPNPLVRSRDISVGGISLSTQIGNSIDPWTPQLQFGGASVGITYSQQIGFAFNFGKLIMAMFQLVLTSKGSSTGNATIAGLPVLALNVSPPVTNFVQNYFPITYANMASSTAVYTVGIAGGTNVANLFKVGGVTNANATDSDFTNTSQIGGTILYITQ